MLLFGHIVLELVYLSSKLKNLEQLKQDTFDTITQKPRVAFHTLGCKLNFSETATIARDFDQNVYERVPFDSAADIYVINTCSVTENADKRFKGLVKKALKFNPEGFIAAIGCYAQLQPEALVAIDGVDLVLGAKEKFQLVNYITDITKKENGAIHACEIQETNFYKSSYSLDDRTRAFLKVQDGCDYKCSYCTIPKARGVSRSDRLEQVIQNANIIAANGIKEIVLTGVNIGDYGKGEFGNKKHEHTFLDLIKSLDEVNAIERIRISSIEPNLLKDDIIDFVASSKRFVPHFHIPLQSGSDRILKRMKRRYLTPLYKDRINKIRTLMPDACIGVDVIVGFPGETNEDFLESYRFLSELEVSYLHVFSYSERPNTLASTFDAVIPIPIRNKRSKLLRGLSAKKRRQFYNSQLGSKKVVLFEGQNKEGYINGFTENYVKIRAPWNPELGNTLKTVRLSRFDEDGYVRFDETD